MSTISPERWWDAETLEPRRWGPLIEPVVQLLEICRDRERFPPSLVLVGPDGLGRELAATEAAALLTCPGTRPRGCGCSSCGRVRRGTHPDVTLVLPQGPGQMIRIEQVREVVEAVSGRPFEAPRRVWIVDGVEVGRLGVEAANAFLKTLEEPPEHAVFLLLAANPDSVLPTIRSRSQQLVLPGSLAAAAQLDCGELPPELASAALRGGAPAETADLAREAVTATSADDEVLHLIRCAHRCREDAHAFQTVAAVAVELATADPASAEGLVTLAADLLAAERSSQVLNLNRERQILSCLLRWFRGL
jgi:DNA polymerase-3 subunit delta'